MPTDHAHRVISLRIYPDALQFIADGEEIARYARSFERHQTFYDFRHYIGLIDRKPGALRNGAPFAEMPDPLLRLQKHLLKHLGGDRIMADVLAAIPVHGLEAVLVAAELAPRVRAPEWRACAERAGPPEDRWRHHPDRDTYLAQGRAEGQYPSLRSPAHGGEPCPLNWWRS